ncbi:GDP/GTP exchange factor for ARF [Coemansia brasiliensis]|uniref:GDP/GTP exchange factor for ARF n=1 Tax=Coemansia brasiliensis TaxID=2650707 RepID=A0A9W8I9P6_9FUNG|nr:GDP/GTP exchange factor for ARF [Coemansia brasiliensis]
MLSSDEKFQKSSSQITEMSFTPLSAESWRLLVEAEIDTIVRELRKNSLWAEAVERDGLGALWVGGSRWPGAQRSANNSELAGSSPVTNTATAMIEGVQSPSTNEVSKMEKYRREFASRRTLGKAGVCIGMASFADKSNDMDESDYGLGRVMILESFLLLREAINGVSDPHLMELQAVIDPFLLVIRDPETTGPITRCALVSIQRFISHGVVDLSRPEAVSALLEMTQAVTHCRFEATDSASDEAVLMQILNVLGALVLSPGGSSLNDVSICEIMETVLSMSCQMRLSEMIRKAAESTLFTLVTFVFGKLNDMQRKAENGMASALEPVVHKVVADNVIADHKHPVVENDELSRSVVSTNGALENGNSSAAANNEGSSEQASSSAAAAAAESRQSFGLPAIRELYRVLVALTNPRDLQYTDTMRLLALNTLQAAFQKACYAMAEYASLRELTLGDLSHNLLLILQRDQPSLISPALRVLYLLFASHRRDAKGHLELFLCQTLGRVMTLPAVARQASRSSLRLGGSRNAGQLNSKANAQQAQSSPRVRPEKSTSKGSEAGLQISNTAERSGSRRSSTTLAHMYTDPEALHGEVPPIPPLLETDGPLSYEQEVELYSEASLKKGMRGRLSMQETRRQLLEGLHHLLIGDDSLITDLWVNYDCDMQRGNMFDFMISYITHRAVPWPSATNDTESEAFLDIMLHHLIRIAVRAGVEPPKGKFAQLLGMPQDLVYANSAGNSSGVAEPGAPQTAASVPLTMAQLLDRKKHKDTMMQAARLFNEKPKEGIAYLQRMGVLSPENSTEMAQQLAFFLRETPTINKQLLGEYLSKPSNLEVLQAYLRLFDFSGRRLDEAMRSLLGTFRLPGESQQIERIMETFSAAYFASDPPDIATKDAAFILAYAIIMLNTDQHSPQVKGRMKFEDFARNLRGVNDKQDFRQGFLTDVYNAIRDHELVFPEEHEGEAGFEYAWHEVSASDSLIGPWMSTRGQTADYDKGLLAATWPRFLQSLARILTHFNSDHTLRLALSGLYALVASAAHYQLTACVNEAMRLLADMTGLHNISSLQADMQASQVLIKSYNRHIVLDPESPTTALGVVAEGFSGAEQYSKLQEQEDLSVQLTQTALEFGKEYRRQVAFIALFELVSRFPSALSKQGWTAVMDIVQIAVDADLVPRQLRAVRDPMAEGMWVPRTSTLQAMDAAQQRIRARRLGAGDSRHSDQQGGGLLSAISSLWSGGGNGTDQYSGASAGAAGIRKQELRWRVSPELLINLVTRSRMAVQASAIDKLGSAANHIGASQTVFLSVLAQLFPQPPPSQPASPADGGASDDGSGNMQPASRSPLAPVPATIDAVKASEGSRALYVPSSVFFFELAVGMVLEHPERAPAVWAAIEAAVQRMLEYADVLNHFALERAVSGVLSMAVRVLEGAAACEASGDSASQVEIVERMLRTVGLLRDANEQTFQAVAAVLMEGIGRLFDTDARALVAVQPNWGIVRLLLKRLVHVQDFAEAHVGGSSCMRRALAVLVEMVILLRCGAIDVPAYFGDMLDTLAAFVPSDRALASSDGGPQSHMAASEVAAKLVAMLYDMQEIAKVQAADSASGGGDCAAVQSAAVHSPPPASPPGVAARQVPHQLQTAQTDPSIASVASGPHALLRHSRLTPLSMWIGAMSALAGYACVNNREVRQLACSHIQRAISSGMDNVQWIASTFSRVLFPLMDTLLRADLLADSTMEDTHARCISMLTMAFLHNASSLLNAPDNRAAAAGSPGAGPRSGPAHPLLASDDLQPAVSADGSGSTNVDTLLSQIWLRLLSTLSVYINTGKMASESSLEPQSPEDAKGRRHGVSLSDSKLAAERRRHLSVLGEMAEESVKNCMLVLNSMGIFGDSDVINEREENVLWQRSWEQLNKVSPQLKQHIFPQSIQPVEDKQLAQQQPDQPANSKLEAEAKSAEEEMPERTSMAAENEAGQAGNVESHDAEKQPEQHLAPSQESKKKKHSRQNIIIVP